MRLSIFAAALCLALPLAAQDSKNSGHTAYRVSLNIREQGSANPARRYDMLVSNDGHSSMRVGTKVPYATSATQPSAGNAKPANSFQFFDAGVSIDARIRVINQHPVLSADVEFNSVQHRDETKASALPPTVASAKVSVNTELAFSKPTVVATVNDPVTQRNFDIEAVIVQID